MYMMPPVIYLYLMKARNILHQRIKLPCEWRSVCDFSIFVFIKDLNFIKSLHLTADLHTTPTILSSYSQRNIYVNVHLTDFFLYIIYLWCYCFIREVVKKRKVFEWKNNKSHRVSVCFKAPELDVCFSCCGWKLRNIKQKQNWDQIMKHTFHLLWNKLFSPEASTTLSSHSWFLGFDWIFRDTEDSLQSIIIVINVIDLGIDLVYI